MTASCGYPLYWQDSTRTLYLGDCRQVLAAMPENSVHCIVSSPPYWGLRLYKGEQEQVWPDGWRGGHGLEPTLAMWIAHEVQILRAVRRVLRPDGVCWWNVGDSAAGSNCGTNDYREQTGLGEQVHQGKYDGQKPGDAGLAALNTCLIPFRLAIALQDDGWYLRQEIIWHKPNPMPQSVHGWFYTRHRVTIEAYEKMQDVWERKHPGQNWPFILQGLPEKEGTAREATLYSQREGEADIPQSLSEAQTITSDSEVESRRTKREGTDKREGTSEKSRKDCETKRISPTLSSERKGQGNDGDEECPPLRMGEKHTEHFNSISMAGDIEATPLSLPLLQKENKINTRPCDTLEQGGATYSQQCSPGVPLMQFKKTRQNRDTLIDCPGCPKCSPNDGLVLRKGNWRPTKAHEYILMLTKTNSYYCDQEAVREIQTESSIERAKYPWHGEVDDSSNGARTGSTFRDMAESDGPIQTIPQDGKRNLRSVWTFATEPFPRELKRYGRHFAAFPRKLPELCIKAGTPEYGVCAKCGAPWARVIEHKNMVIARSNHANESGIRVMSSGTMLEDAETKTLGWRATCKCGTEVVPATVLDCFMGTGTTLEVAASLGRRAIGIDISEPYLKLSIQRNKQGVL